MNALYELDVEYMPLRSELADQEYEVIAPDDSRKCVQNTKIAPYRYVCKIVHLCGDACIRRWTGIMIGPRTVLTLARWLAVEQPPKPDAQGNIKLIPSKTTYVFPGAKGQQYPFNKRGIEDGRAAALVVYPDWALAPAVHSDLAVIILQKPIGTDSKWWTFDFHKWPGDPIGTSILQKPLPDPRNLNLRIAGYPRELPNKPGDPCYNPKDNKPGNEQYEDANRGVRITTGGGVLEYLMDTSVGMGGSPVWCDTQKLGRILGAVHATGNDSQFADMANRGVLIRSQNLSFIRSFCYWPRDKTPPPRPVLKKGMKLSLDLLEVQYRLATWIAANPQRRLASTLNESGFGTKTLLAVQAFQKTMGMQGTGVVDKATWNRLQWPF